ncbi:MAG: HNH endonuclease [Chloroflexi bacterium]|nr:HNH endonuclease [Chloroflexota bacterium]
MTAARLSRALRARVSAQARHRCGYCLTVEAIVGTPMEVDHIIPRALAGPTDEDNLRSAALPPSPCASIAPRWSRHDKPGSRLGGIHPQTNGGRVGTRLVFRRFRDQVFLDQD